MKTTLFRSTAVLLAAVLVFLSVGCSKSEPVKRTKTYLDLFDTVIEITGYESSAAEFDAVCAKVYALTKEYHALCDIYQSYPGVLGAKALNETAAQNPVKVEDKLFALLSFAKEMAVKTDGACNIAMGSVLSLWHAARENGVLPDADALKAASAHTDIHDLVLDEKEKTVYFADPDLKIDLGAVAKGYAAERAYALLIALGKTDGYLLNFGGNVKVLGDKPDGSEWQTGIENPMGEGYLKTFGISDAAVVTSGSHKRGYTVDGMWYHHIIDPKTLSPADYFAQVTVICSDSGVADCLSTAVFCMDRKEGEKLLRRFDASAVWVAPDGTVFSQNESQ